MNLRILHIGEETLREPSEPVTEINDDIRQLVQDMFETMYKANGVGLAAPQVGRNIRLFVIDLDGKSPMVFSNPEIVKKTGKETCEEGCLSVPGFREDVQRAKPIIAEATDLAGLGFEVTAEGLMARAIQHELDHLEGVLFVDRISKARKMQIKSIIDRLQVGDFSGLEELEDDAEDEAPGAVSGVEPSSKAALS